MKRAVVIGIGAALLVVIVLGVVFLLRGVKGGAKPVETALVKPRTIKSTVIAFGRVEPKSDVDISAQVTEKIESLFVVEGDTVEVGDTLVVLAQDRLLAALRQAEANFHSAQSQVRQAEANLRRAQENLRKLRKLHESGAVSDDQLLEAQTEVKVLEAQLAAARNGVEAARAALEEARDNLAKTVITAPIDGVVTSIKANQGEFVVVGTMNNPGSIIMTIAQLSDLLAEVDVDEADIVDVEPGQQALVELDALPDTSFLGRVVQVSHQAKVRSVGGEETRASFEVKIAIQNPSPKIRPGMSVTATITTAQKDSVLAVPLSCVVAYRDSLGEGEGVFVVEGGVARKVRIKTGISDDKYIEVVDGLGLGDRVVTGPFRVLRQLRDGDRVRVLAGRRRFRRSGRVRGQAR